MTVAERGNQAINDILLELRQAVLKYPTFPTDKIYAGAILAEESGELVQACNDYVHNKESDKTKMKTEAAQVGAMAIRFLIISETSIIKS